MFSVRVPARSAVEVLNAKGRLLVLTATLDKNVKA
jgi:hypothetical protein